MSTQRSVRSLRLSLTVALVVALGSLAPTAQAGARSRAARELADSWISRFGAKACGESAEALSRRAERLVLRYGDEAVVAVRKVGPRTFRLIEEAGEHGPAAVKLMARHGDEAVWIVSRPRRLAIFVRHGDDAATALLRHRTTAETLIGQFDAPVVRALNAINARNGRCLAMLAESGELSRSGRASEILALIGRHGDRACAFLWKHKGLLAGGAALIAFLANPEPYLDGAAEIAEKTATAVAQPVTTVARAAGTQLVNRISRAGLLVLASIGLVWSLYPRTGRSLRSLQFARNSPSERR